jgi:hypothetical protein
VKEIAMKLDVKSLIVGAVVVGALWFAFSGSQTIAQQHYRLPAGDVSSADYQLEVGPNGEMYVMYRITGETRRVWQENGQWFSQLVIPHPKQYLNRTVTTQR